MSWHPNDLVSDYDLVDYESRILTHFGATSWQARRTKALEHWLFPILKGQGFDPYALRTRHAPAKAWQYTASSYTDRTAVVASEATDDLSLAAVFATPASDALYVGSTAPFRGVFLRLLDAVSATAGVMSAAYWSGTWEGLTIQDKTAQTAGTTLSGGGSVTWTLPADWATRAVNTAGPYYWVRLTVSAVPSGAMLSQVGCIRTSALCAPATLRTLSLIMREAPTSSEGPWAAKAEYYEKEADAALQRALPLIGGEFDTSGDDVIDTTEAAQTSAAVGGGWRLERG